MSKKCSGDSVFEEMLPKSEAVTLLNQLGSNKQSFSFYCDFLGEHWMIASDEEEKPFDLEIGTKKAEFNISNLEFRRFPVSKATYSKSFDRVIEQINIGNSFLTNLTFETRIETNLSLEQIFRSTQAKYKLLVPEQFVVFSPETFVQIREDRIYSSPMKGTIDASIPNAAEVILNDPKETAEHVTIVDLIRNDLSQVAKEVSVPKFRYIDEINTHHKKLLQVSSQIMGTLSHNWEETIGTLLSKLLPAGSISGAPKPETLRIIQEVENYSRGFYTGICGHFDGKQLDTGVMIRFIKQERDQLRYCSGGGITSFSEVDKEYQELVDKVYLPVV